MKSGAAILVLTATLRLTAAWTRADDAPPPATIRADVQMVSVSPADAAQLVPALQSPKTAPAAWTHLQEMIGRGEATLIGWPVVWSQNGTRSTAEEIAEKRSPTEFTPPQEPTIFEQPPLHYPTWGSIVPTAFETRDVGCKLDVEATVEPGGQIVDLKIQSLHVRDAGTREWHTQKSPAGVVGIVQTPIFQTERLTTAMRVHRDQPILVGVFVVSEPTPPGGTEHPPRAGDSTPFFHLSFSNAMKRLLLAFALVLLAVSGAALSAEPEHAQPATDSPNIRIELQVVAIPEQIGIQLATEMKSKDKIEAAHARIQQMLAKGTAKLIGWPIVTTRSGMRAVIEDIKEIRYATEYHPPTVSINPNTPVEPAIKVAPTVDVVTFEGVPSAFETRNTGVTLEVEPVLKEDGKAIDLNIVPQHVRLEGFHKITIEGAARKGKVIVEQPEFKTNKVTTTVTMQSGQRILMGVYPTEDPPKHLEFFILKVEAVPVE